MDAEVMKERDWKSRSGDYSIKYLSPNPDVWPEQAMTRYLTYGGHDFPREHRDVARTPDGQLPDVDEISGAILCGRVIADMLSTEQLPVSLCVNFTVT